jgi:L-lactate dehydrogenase complex protein LldG
MTNARAAILNRVRQAQRTARLPAAPLVKVPAPPAHTADECLRRFLDELGALGVEAHVEQSAADVRARVAACVAGRSVFSWDPEWLPYGVGSVLVNVTYGRSPGNRHADAEVGVTGCDAAIADTGSLVLLSGEGRPRAASLLPPVHLAIVRRADLRFAMDEYFREHADAISSAACCTFVTGPSRTADIELTLTVGVHGPGQVIVVVGPVETTSKSRS